MPVLTQLVGRRFVGHRFVGRRFVGHRRDRRVLIAALLAMALSTSTIAAAARAGAGAVQPAADPPAVSIRYNLAYGSLDIEKADVYTPAGFATPLPAIMIIHGGGWHSGSKGGWRDGAIEMAQAGFVVVVVNYELASSTVAGFPRQLHELKQAVEWMRSDAADLAIDPRRIGAFGSSAGGNLAAMLATDGFGPLDTGTRIAAAVTWSAILDLTHQPGLSNATADYVGCHTDCDDVLADASPIHHVSSGDTPMKLFNSDHELVRLNDVQAMDARLTGAHVEHEVVIYPGSAHGVSYAEKAMPGTVAFFQHELAR